MRFECEYELKRLLIKYEQEFILYGNSDKYLKQVCNQVIKTLLVIFRSILRIYNKPVPYLAIDITEQVSQFLSFDKNIIQKMVKVKYDKEKYNKAEWSCIKTKLIFNLQQILKQINEIDV